MHRPILPVLALAGLPLLAQKPVINIGGVVNAASFAPVDGPSHAIVPGAIASIFGRNLALSVAVADSYPLPRTLGGTSVTVNGVAVPLFYVSPGQINFQVPSSTNRGDFTVYGKASIVVSTAGGGSDPVSADVWTVAPGIFTLNGTGCGPALVVNVKPDGTRWLNSPSNSASPGDYLEVYGTGFGELFAGPPDGMPAPANPPFVALGWAGGGVFGLTQLDGGLRTFAGRAPGFAGVDQVNLLIPTNIRQGCSVPLQVSAYPLMSQPVTVSIHSGGGQCLDPPIGSGGSLVLTKSVVLNDNSIPESHTLTASLTASPGQTIRILPFTDGFSVGSNVTDSQGPACPVPGYTTLNPGPINLTGQSGADVQVRAVPAGSLGRSTGNPYYQATLPAGFVQPGTYQVSSAGVADVGPFQTTLNIGSGIQVTSQFPKGPLTGGTNPFTVKWTGGQPGTVVMLRLIEHEFLFDRSFSAIAPATQGVVSIGGTTISNPPPPACNCDMELDILVGPDPSEPPQIIAVPGLTLGLQVRWLYEYRFIGLR